MLHLVPKQSCSHRLRVALILGALMILLSGCNGVTAIASATTTVPATATDSATSTTPATSTAIPTVSPAPPGGVCNAVDFPAPIRQRPTPGVGGDPGPFYGAPDDELVFPLGTYYYDHGSAAGTHFWNVCSPG